MTTALLIRAGRYRACGAAVALALALVALSPRAASAQTAAAFYARAQAQEVQLGEAAPVEALRRVAKDYEAIVLRFPASAYCDNALWQAAQLLDRAWRRFSEPRDRDEAVRVFTWLAKEYPTGSLARQATAQGAALKASPGAAPQQSPPPPTPTPPAPTPPAATPPSQAVPPTQPPSAPVHAGPPVVVRSIARSALPRGDRITVELSDEAAYTGNRVGSPDRIFFDFANATLAASVAEDVRRVTSPLIKTVRVGSPTKGVTRVVMELTGAPRYSAFFLYSPFRLVIDVETTAFPPVAQVPHVPPASRTVAVLPTPTPTPTPGAPVAGNQANAANNSREPPASPVSPSSTGRGDYSLARQLGLRVARIVIDPGHGGHDPGATSNGVTESELVLDIALRLEKLLQQTPGVEVVLTRRTNEFVPLEERTAIANRERADLFLSIHANSHRQSKVSGIETYFLSFATNQDAEAVAARENAASVQTMGTLPAIVKAIALNNKLDESRELAAQLQTNLTRRARSQSPAARDLGVKQAPFVVLIGAQMPSVLTEIAFLTNKTEAGLLKQPAYRQLLAQALRDALVKYQDSLKRVSATSAQPRRE